MTRLLCVSSATGPTTITPGTPPPAGTNRPHPGASNPHRDGTEDLITVRLEESVAGNEGFPAWAAPCSPTLSPARPLRPPVPP